MRYRSRVYVCSRFLWYIDHETYRLNINPYSLDFFDREGNCVGHVESFQNLPARVQIYEQDNPAERKDAFVISKSYVFRNKGPYVVDSKDWRIQKYFLIHGHSMEVVNDPENRNLEY